MSYDIIPGSHKSSFPESQAKNRWAVVFFPQASSAPLGFLKPSQTQGCLLFSFWIGGLELNVGHVVNKTPRPKKWCESYSPSRNNNTTKNTTQRLTRVSSCWFYFVVFFSWFHTIGPTNSKRSWRLIWWRKSCKNFGDRKTAEASLTGKLVGLRVPPDFTHQNLTKRSNQQPFPEFSGSFPGPGAPNSKLPAPPAHKVS